MESRKYCVTIPCRCEKRSCAPLVYGPYTKEEAQDVVDDIYNHDLDGDIVAFVTKIRKYE
jgi:hypothetical protein